MHDLPPLFSKLCPNKITNFNEKLFFIVQVFDEMNKLRDIKVCQRFTLDKLPKIMGNFVRLDDEWQVWEFLKLAESLCNRTDRNLKTIKISEKHKKDKRENIFQLNAWECKNRESNSKTSVCKILRNQDIKPASVSQSIRRSSVG